jgi:hypothetical protein
MALLTDREDLIVDSIDGRTHYAETDKLAGHDALEPGTMVALDTHHHLWTERGRYLVEELLADTGTGHNVEATVFIECRTNDVSPLRISIAVHLNELPVCPAPKKRERPVRYL